MYVERTTGMRLRKEFHFQNVKGRDHFGDLGKDGKTIFASFSEKQNVRLWSGFIWLRLGTSGELL